MYSGDLKSDHSKLGNIWILDFLNIQSCFKRVAIAIQTFFPDVKWFLTKWRTFIQILNGQASEFQIPFKIGSICKPPLFDHLKTWHIWISDSNCITNLNMHWCVIQLGSYWTSLVFKWLKRGWMPNFLVFVCHLNTRWPNHLNTGQIDAILFLMYWSSICMVSLVHRT